MALHTARVRIFGAQANIASVGGYNKTFSGGSAWGRDEDGNIECLADLGFGDSGGVGASFHWASKELTYDCENVDCAFKNGNPVLLTVITFIFITMYKMDFGFCESKGSGWKVGLGLGLGYQGCTWGIKNLHSP